MFPLFLDVESWTIAEINFVTYQLYKRMLSIMQISTWSTNIVHSFWYTLFNSKSVCMLQASYAFCFPSMLLCGANDSCYCSCDCTTLNLPIWVLLIAWTKFSFYNVLLWVLRTISMFSQNEFYRHAISYGASVGFLLMIRVCIQTQSSLNLFFNRIECRFKNFLFYLFKHLFD